MNPQSVIRRELWIQHAHTIIFLIEIWFDTYKKIDKGSVSLGDDHPCKVAGVGTIRVRMYDGVIRT